MAYIPEKHKKYDLLPVSTEHGYEAIVYNSTIRLEELLRRYHPLKERLNPYGYDTLDEYIRCLDEMIAVYSEWPEALNALMKYKADVIDLNRKEYWSVCRYLGPNIYRLTGLTQGKAYYWPCAATNPGYCGVIDDEEFTNYLYPTNPDLWEILDDPTGMVTRLFNDMRKKKEGT